MGLRKCAICGKEIKQGYGHNPAPIKDTGRCCDKCDDLYVFPYRIAESANNEELKRIVIDRVNAL